MSGGQNSRSFGTHDGPFHADEVTACALLLVFDLIDEDKIVRSRDPKLLDVCEFVCDVGGLYSAPDKRFDHHQSSYNGEMASAGMILLYLRDEKVIDESLYGFLNGSLVRGVDAHDNGRELQAPGVCTFSHVVSNYNPVRREALPQEFDDAFICAVRFVREHLSQMVERYRYVLSCRELVAESMARYKRCLIFEKNIPWLESFFDLDGERHPANFVIMPAAEHWKLRGIPPSYSERMKVRVPLPEQWAGLLEGELKEATGISGAVFCHKGRFISVWETKEDALRALELVEKLT